MILCIKIMVQKHTGRKIAESIHCIKKLETIILIFSDIIIYIGKVNIHLEHFVDDPLQIESLLGILKFKMVVIAQYIENPLVKCTKAVSQK